MFKSANSTLCPTACQYCISSSLLMCLHSDVTVSSSSMSVSIMSKHTRYPRLMVSPKIHGVYTRDLYLVPHATKLLVAPNHHNISNYALVPQLIKL